MASPSRKEGAAAVLRTAPAYSFGTRNWPSVEDRCGPGPAAYNVKLKSSNFLSSPGVGFRTSTRNSTYGNGNPGPQDYDPSLKVTHPSGPAAAIKGRFKPPDHGDQQPGPGQYKADVADSKARHPQAPAHSMAARWVPDREAERQPAPGEYSPVYEAKQPLPCSLKGRWSDSPRGDSSCSPGPGEYRPEGSPPPRGRSSAVHTMGGSRPKPRRSESLPGPGHYSPYLFPRPATSFPKSERDFSSRYEVRPGPGSYFTHQIYNRPGGYGVDSLRRSARVVTICSRPIASTGGGTPGPGGYDPRLELARSSSPCFTFRGVNAKNHLAKNPGPGHYSPERSQLRVSHPCPPALTMSPQLFPPQDCEKRPPPGEYDPDRYRHKSGGAVSMKFRYPIHEEPHKVAPGPGEYPLRSSLGGPGFTMGIRLKVKGKEELPGPAEYDMQDCTLGTAAPTRRLGRPSPR